MERGHCCEGFIYIYILCYPRTEDWELLFRVGNGSRAALEGAAGEQGRAPREQGRAPREQGRAPREQGGASREQGRAPREQGGASREQGRAPRARR